VLGRLVSLLMVLIVVALIIGALLAGATLVLAFIGPGLGLTHLGRCWSRARALWRSGGRLPIPGGYRVLDASRTRMWSVLELASGFAGVAAGLAPTLWLIGPAGGQSAAPGLLAAGLTGLVLFRALARRVLRGARSVDVLE